MTKKVFNALLIVGLTYLGAYCALFMAGESMSSGWIYTSDGGKEFVVAEMASEAWQYFAGFAGVLALLVALNWRWAKEFAMECIGFWLPIKGVGR